MGVYMPNVEKPRGCNSCPLVMEIDNTCSLTMGGCTKDERPPHCPLIEIVRCGECKWWDSDDGNIGYCHAEKHSHFSKNWEISIYRKYKADHFCSDGERRNDERTTE